MMMWMSFAFLLMSAGVFSGKMSRYTNIKCEVLDPSYCAYKQCNLKLIGRGVVALNVHAILLKGPLYVAKVNLSLWRKYSGFRPFMFNKTFDFCKFMARTTNKLSFERIFLDALSKNSNLNHSCPYEKEIRVQEMIYKKEYFRFLPLNSGEYQIQLVAAADNQWKTRVYVNFLIDEDLK